MKIKTLSLISILFINIVLSCKDKVVDNNVIPTNPTNPSDIKPGVNVGFGANLLSPEEYEKVPLFKDPQVGSRMAATNGKEPTIAKSYDISSKMPIAGNQGLQGSCVAWALAYATRSYFNNSVKGVPYIGTDGKLNEETVFSPAFIYNQINKGKDNGSFINEGLELMKNSGVCTLKDMPYLVSNFTTQPNDAQKKRAENFKIKNWGKISISESVFKKFIYFDYPIIIAANIDDNFKNLKEKLSNNEYAWNTQSTNPSGHAMVIIGYDDDKKAFKVQNSWGDKWANNGTIWISYELTPKVIKEAYIMVPIEQSSAISIPSVKTEANGTIATNGEVVINGSISDLGGSPILKYGFCISDKITTPIEQTEIIGNPIKVLPHSFSFKSRISTENGAKLYYRAFVETPDAVYYGNTVTVSNTVSAFALVQGCHNLSGTNRIQKLPGSLNNEIIASASLGGFGNYQSFDDHGFYLYPISIRRDEISKNGTSPIKISLGKLTTTGVFQTTAKNLLPSMMYSVLAYVKPTNSPELFNTNNYLGGCLYQTAPDIKYTDNTSIRQVTTITGATLTPQIQTGTYSLKNKTLYFKENNALYTLKDGETSQKLFLGKINNTYIPEPIDGDANTAVMSSTSHMAADNLGNIFTSEFSEKYKIVIRKIDPAGKVTTLARNNYTGNNTDWTIVDGDITTATIRKVNGMVCDSDNNLWILDNKTIRKITPNGNISTYCGDRTAPASRNTFIDGSLSSVRLASPNAITIDEQNNLYIIDRSQIRRINNSGSTTISGRDVLVNTEWYNNIKINNNPVVAGASTSLGHYIDGEAKSSDFYDPTQLFYKAGAIYVIDNWHPDNQYSTYTIRKVTIGGTVRTIAGKTATNHATNLEKNIGNGTDTFIDSNYNTLSNNQYFFSGDKIWWSSSSRLYSCTL